MADLYGDLDTSAGGQSSMQLKKELQTIRVAHEKLKQEAATLQRLNKELAERNQVLESNMSVLFATAQHEIARKDKAIHDLRDEMHDMTQRHAPRDAHGRRPSSSGRHAA
ncbi:Aste57867_24068 [Aphanomyces stellatus]|uniref:Aste57867_24068 protein n=1 Tax=Aphanomyces stellatus TaxID=120398 RepID=A0A485LR18_9STRA|nr:hypothetical protein As57867_023995 [Aphanomyces stellatus]VFU00711.1 Aste57867_24068 [Aphanomyces stellatus]